LSNWAAFHAKSAGVLDYILQPSFIFNFVRRQSSGDVMDGRFCAIQQFCQITVLLAIEN
jgi:hypothetical protein